MTVNRAVVDTIGRRTYHARSLVTPDTTFPGRLLRPSARAAAVALALVLSCIGSALPFRAAAAPQASEPVKLALGEQSAQPGAQVVLPLTLSAGDDVQAGSIEVRVTFKTAHLKFVKVEPSGLSLGVGATIEATVGKGPDAASSTLLLKISTVPGAPGRAPLAPGVLAYVAFTIPKEVKPATSIPLTVATVIQSADAAPRAIAPVVTGNGKVTVAAPPVPACFFYMH